jgi:hypothetical protein
VGGVRFGSPIRAFSRPLGLPVRRLLQLESACARATPGLPTLVALRQAATSRVTQTLSAPPPPSDSHRRTRHESHDAPRQSHSHAFFTERRWYISRQKRWLDLPSNDGDDENESGRPAGPCVVSRIQMDSDRLVFDGEMGRSPRSRLRTIGVTTVHGCEPPRSSDSRSSLRREVSQ